MKDTAGAVDWREADITRLELGQTYDAITCVARTLDFGAKVVGGTRLDALKVAWASGDR
jgi:hypothetical protein